MTRPKVASSAPAPSPNLRALFLAHYASMRRLLHRLGVPEADLDDAAQELFWVAARRIDDIQSGSEHAFLYGVALRIAATERKKLRAAHSTCELAQAPGLTSPLPSPEDELSTQRARELLHVVLDRMSPDLRTAFVLYELEHLELREIAALEHIPQGTAASRLRRAREEFSTQCQRLRGLWGDGQ